MNVRQVFSQSPDSSNQSAMPEVIVRKVSVETYSVAQVLVYKGVPASDIVLGFHSPFKRQ
ncbi:MAG: element excision factor XisI family protein, partial [Cyanobacteria bacterium J06607_10]